MLGLVSACARRAPCAGACDEADRLTSRTEFLNLPTMGGSRYAPVFTLSKAEEQGFLARVTCRNCRITRHYRPMELGRLIYPGRTIDDVAARMRCERCGQRDRLRAELWSPTGQEAAGIKLRRLVAIQYVRRVVWRDEE